jgi:hypothetical protein
MPKAPRLGCRSIVSVIVVRPVAGSSRRVS